MGAGRVVVVTGGTSGIGLGIAERHLAAGDRVVIGSIDVEADTPARLRLDQERVRFMRVDVSVEADVAALVSLALSEFGQLDVMVNNAGIGDGGLKVPDWDADRIRRTTSVLFEGVALGMKHAARAMIPRKSGSIINIASIAGISTHINSGHIYSAAKAAVVHLTKTTSLELAADGVRVNCICPGYIATPLFGRGFGLSGDKLRASVEVAGETFADLQPIHRTGRPTDIAAAAFWLSSDEASFVTGLAFVVDGGASVGNPYAPEKGRGRLVKKALEDRGII